MNYLIVLLFTCSLLMSTLFGMQEVGAVQGIVIDAKTGFPIPRAKVTLAAAVDPNEPPVPRYGDEAHYAPSVLWADSAGYFYFGPELVEKVFSRQILVFATADGYAFSAQKVPRAGSTQTLTLKLAAPLEVSGVIRTSEGVPIAGAAVGDIYQDPRLKWGAIALPSGAVFTDGDGKFTVAVSAEYSFLIEADHPDFLPAATRIFPPGLNDLPPLELRLEPGLEVSGTLVNEDTGTPLGEVKLRLAPKSRRTPYHPSRAFRLDMWTVTSGDGTFYFRGVSPGEKTLEVWGPFGVIKELPILLEDSNVTGVQVTLKEKR